MISKIAKISCVVVMILEVLVMILKISHGEHINMELIHIGMLFFAYKLVDFGKKKGDENEDN